MINKICFVSDLHGHLPKIPDCDILCIAGDICPVWNHDLDYQFNWLRVIFRDWLEKLVERGIKVVGIAGNHDLIAEESPEVFDLLTLPWTYLENSGAEIEGLKFWGSPYSNLFGNWAFMEKDEDLAEIWEKIPDDTNILMVHGPMFGYLDYSLYGNTHTGSKTLLKKVEKLSKLGNLKVLHTGHIHSEYGMTDFNKIICVNGTLVNEDYQMVYNPLEINI